MEKIFINEEYNNSFYIYVIIQKLNPILFPSKVNVVHNIYISNNRSS